MNRTLQARQNQRKLFQQQENAALLYSVNYASELDTDTIATSTWTKELSTGAALTDDTNTTNSTSVRISGDVGKHVITNKITTTSGNTMERQLIIKVLDNDFGMVSDYC